MDEWLLCTSDRGSIYANTKVCYNIKDLALTLTGGEIDTSLKFTLIDKLDILGQHLDVFLDKDIEPDPILEAYDFTYTHDATELVWKKV